MAKENDNETQIRRLLDRWTAAVRKRDLEGVMSCYTRDIVSFDLMPPLLHEGEGPFRKTWQTAFEMTERFEIALDRLNIAASGELGVGHALMRAQVHTRAGKDHDNWMRVTWSFARDAGAWKIRHEHTSVPIEWENMKALVDLEP